MVTTIFIKLIYFCCEFCIYVQKIYCKIIKEVFKNYIKRTYKKYSKYAYRVIWICHDLTFYIVYVSLFWSLSVIVGLYFSDNWEGEIFGCLLVICFFNNWVGMLYLSFRIYVQLMEIDDLLINYGLNNAFSYIEIKMKFHFIFCFHCYLFLCIYKIATFKFQG